MQFADDDDDADENDSSSVVDARCWMFWTTSF